MKVVVAGAGVMGLSAALALAERGIEVEVVEKGPRPGPHACAWHAGGMLAPFCEGESAEPEVVRLGQEAASWWAERVPGVVRRGTLVVAARRDAAELSRFARRTERHQWLDGNGVAALEPDLDRFERALFFPEEAHLDPRVALAALAERLAGLGVPIRYATPLEQHDTDGRLVIDARGLGAREALPELRGIRGEMLVLRSSEISLTRPVRLLHPRHPVYVVPRGNGVHMVGATQVESEGRGPITLRGAMELLGTAYTLHPAFAEAEILETGSNLRPAFPDNLPRILRKGGTIHVNGLYRHGFLLAPAMARRLVAMVAELLETENAHENRLERATA
ncbi:MAG: glycine oxidase ThiO [Parvibaculaceae bacterium]